MPDTAKKQRINAECFKLFKTVSALQGTRRLIQNLAGECRIHQWLSQISAGLLPNCFAVETWDQQSPQCDWGFRHKQMCSTEKHCIKWTLLFLWQKIFNQALQVWRFHNFHIREVFLWIVNIKTPYCHLAKYLTRVFLFLYFNLSREIPSGGHNNDCFGGSIDSKYVHTSLKMCYLTL